MKGDIQIIKPRSTKDNMPYIHENYVTPYFSLVGEELKWDNTSFFYGYGGSIPQETLYGLGCGVNFEPR